MRKAKLFIINVVILTFTSILMQTIGITFSVYISNKIGAKSIGLFGLIMSIYAFFVTVANSGMNLASTRVISEQNAIGDKKGSVKAIKQCIFYSFLFGLFSCILLILSSDFIATKCLHSKISPLPLYIIAFSLPFISMSTSISGYFSAIRKVSKTASAQVLEQIVKIVITVYLFTILLPKGLDYACIALVIGTCISEAFSFIYVYILYKLEIRKEKKLINDNFKDSSKLKIKNSYSKDIFKICVPIAITSYIRSGLSTLKQLLIPKRLEASGIGCDEAIAKYGIINGMVLPIILFPSVFINSFAGLIIPEFSSIFVTKNYKRIKTLTERIFKYTIMFSSCVFGIFLNFSDELASTLYSNSEVAKYLLYLSPIVIIMYLDTIVDSMLKGLNEQVNVMKCNIIDLFVSIGFIYFLLPMYSLNGFIIVLYISELLNGFISIRQLIKVTKIKINYISWFVKPILVALLARITINFFNFNFPSDIATLIFNILVYIIIYIFYLFLTSVLKKSDLKL